MPKKRTYDDLQAQINAYLDEQNKMKQSAVKALTEALIGTDKKKPVVEGTDEALARLSDAELKAVSRKIAEYVSVAIAEVKGQPEPEADPKPVNLVLEPSPDGQFPPDTDQTPVHLQIEQPQ